MKKNFFKNLASVLAVAMVVTTVAPASAAQAATVKLNNASKAIYMSTANGYGVSKGSYTLKISGAAKTAKTTWKTSAKSVATVSSKGKVTAKKVGKATITATVKNAKGKKVATKTCKVQIKDNAKSVVISNAEAGKTIAVGAKAFDYNRTLVGTAGGASTDKTYWFITEDTAGATVDGNGVVSTTKAGSFKLQAKTAQNKTQAAAGEFTAVSEVLEVKVPVAVLDAKCVATNKVEINLNSAFAGKTSDILVVNKDTRLKLPVKSFELKNDGKTIVATMDSSFANNKTYTVTIADSTKEFAVAIGKIAAINVEDQVIPAATPSDIVYTVTDENGVDITADYPVGKLKFTFSQGGLVDNKLTLGDKMSTFVTIEYVQFDTTGKDITVKSKQVKVTGSLANMSSISAWTLAEKTSDVNYDKVVQTVNAEDYSKTLYFKYKNSLGKDDETNKTGTKGATFTSLNSSILIVDKNTGKLYPQKAGTVEVKIETSAGVVGYVTVTVAAKAEFTSIVTDPSSVTLSTTSKLTDEKDVTVKFKDAAGNDIAVDNTKVLKASVIVGDAKVVSIKVGAFASDNKSAKLTLTPGEKGNATVKVEYEGKAAYIQVSVVEPAAVAQYMVETSADKVDAKTPTNLTFKVFSADAAGAKVEAVTGGKFSVVNEKGEVVKDASGRELKDITMTTNNDVVVVSTATKEMATGKYTIKVTLGTYLATKDFVVETTRAAATLVVNSYTAEAASGTSIRSAIDKMIKVKVDGTDVAVDKIAFFSGNTNIIANALKVNDLVSVDGVSATAQTGTVNLYITKVQVTVGGFIYEVAVNDDFVITVK